MPTKITMPQLGESVNEGTVGRWLKTEGDTVKKDESLVEIITDKVTAELPSPVSGRLVKILVTEDQTVGVGAAIAEIEESGGGATTATTATSSSQTSAGTSSAGPTAPPASASSAGAASNGASMAQSTSRLAQTSVRDRPEKVSPL
ncbi:MAG TPA: biotin/lipoyl-containing protein, partial [Ktedonobacterales bacterium]|nr:biotin/lipoyl-containing protein [Ktedonobacterales bacterium]